MLRGASRRVARDRFVSNSRTNPPRATTNDAGYELQLYSSM